MMFNRRADRLKLVIGEGSTITGDVESLGTVIVNGTIIGHIAGEKAVLGEKAFVKGDITAKSVIMEGRIEGSLRGKELVEIGATGKVIGDIYASRLSIMEGAVFQGKCCMIQNESPEQQEKMPAGQFEDGKVVELFVKEKSGSSGS
jgi:cytoskeletal protein CcmA (bactofilin family)